MMVIFVISFISFSSSYFSSKIQEPSLYSNLYQDSFVWVQSQVASYQTLKMVLDTSLLNTQQYEVRIEGKVEQSRERSNALPYTLV